VSGQFEADAEAAIADAVEGSYPLCRVRLVVHDGAGCCPCCGDSYRAAEGRLEIRKCPDHGTSCAHWEAVWAAR
jgi:transposase